MKYYTDCTVQSINCSGGQIRGVTVKKDDVTTEVQGDYYVSALPVERMAPLITLSLSEADPRLSHLPQLATNVAWMNGIQFYITHLVPIAHGHVIYIDTPWALTSVSQSQFWPDFDLSKFSDGDTRDILSVDISDWETEGVLYGKRASDCTREEIAHETWEQLKRSLNHMNGNEVLKDEHLDYWFLDPDIRRDPEERRRHENVEPLLVNLIDTWRLRPDAVTAIPNLFLASDYVRTHTDLATMESANEAARRAVNGILEHCGSGSPHCQVWELHEPEILQPWREYDRARWEKQLPWEDPLALMSIAKPVIDVIEKTGALSNLGRGPLSGISKAYEAVSTASEVLGENQLPQAETLMEVPELLLSRVGMDPMKMVHAGDVQKQLSEISSPLIKGVEELEEKSQPHQPGRLRIVQKR
jgi:hypothetical protein